MIMARRHRWHFSLTDLSNRSGEVVEAAFRGPVEITRRGKRKFVLLTAEDYDRLVRAADTRHAFSADDATVRSKAHYDIGTLSAQDGQEEQAIDELKYRKASMSVAEYRQQLSKYLVDLAKTQEALDK